MFFWSYIYVSVNRVREIVIKQTLRCHVDLFFRRLILKLKNINLEGEKYKRVFFFEKLAKPFKKYWQTHSFIFLTPLF